MPDFFMRIFTGIHRKLYQLTGGKVGGADKTLVLHHKGAKSGKERQTILLYQPEGDGYMLVASKAGAEQSPAWFHNLMANPDVKVTIGKKDVAVRATRMSAAEKEKHWPTMVKIYPTYEKYTAKTDRDFPMVKLSPR